MVKNAQLSNDLEFVKEFEELKLKQRLLLDSLKGQSKKDETLAVLTQMNAKLDFLVEIFKKTLQNEQGDSEDPMHAVLEKLTELQNHVDEKFEQIDHKLSAQEIESKSLSSLQDLPKPEFKSSDETKSEDSKKESSTQESSSSNEDSNQKDTSLGNLPPPPNFTAGAAVDSSKDEQAPAVDGGAVEEKNLKMALKKELIKELKQYNDDLEKHISSVSYDDVDKVRFNDHHKKEEKDYMSIVANSVVDLRTEVALLRKNLTTDIENLVAKNIEHQQQNFKEELKSFTHKIELDLKESFATYINELSSSIFALKKEVNSLALKSSHKDTEYNDISNDLLSLKAQLNSVSHTTVDSKKALQTLIYHQEKALSEKQTHLFKRQESKIKDIHAALIKMNREVKDMREDVVHMNQIPSPQALPKEVANVLDINLDEPPSKAFNESPVRKILEIDKKIKKLENV